MQGSKLIINISKGATIVKATMCQSSLHRFAFLGRIISKSTKSDKGKGNGIEVSTPNEHAWIWVYMAYDFRKCVLIAYIMLPSAKLIK